MCLHYCFLDHEADTEKRLPKTRSSRLMNSRARLRSRALGLAGHILDILLKPQATGSNRVGSGAAQPAS